MSILCDDNKINVYNKKILKLKSSDIYHNNKNLKNVIEELGNQSTGSGCDNMVFVRSVNDLPTPVGGEIPLEDGKEYKLCNPIILSTPLKISDGANINISALTGKQTIFYTGPGALFRGNEVGIFQITALLCGAINDIFDLRGASVNSVFVTFEFIIIQCATIGRLERLIFSQVISKYRLFDQGLTLVDMTNATFSSTNVSDTNNTPGCVFFTIEGVLNDNIRFNACTFAPQSNESIFDIKQTSAIISGNVSSNAVSLDLGGSVFASGSKDIKDIYWTYTGNNNIKNSNPTIVSYSTGTPILTTFSVPLSLVQVNVTGTIYRSDNRLEINDRSRILYYGIEDSTLQIDGILSARPETAAKNILCLFGHIYLEDFNIAFDNTLNRVNEIGTAVENGDTITFKNNGGTLPTGLRKDVCYYVINKSTDFFQLAYINGGAVVPFTDDGTGGPFYYSYVELSQGASRDYIDSNRSRDMNPMAEFDLKTGEEVICYIMNLDDAVSIYVNSIYLRVNS